MTENSEIMNRIGAEQNDTFSKKIQLLKRQLQGTFINMPLNISQKAGHVKMLIHIAFQLHHLYPIRSETAESLIEGSRYVAYLEYKTCYIPLQPVAFRHIIVP